MKSLRQKFSIRHFRNEKGTGAEMCPTIVSGIVSGDGRSTTGLLCDKRDIATTCEFCRDVILKESEVCRKVISFKIIVTLDTQGLQSSFLSCPVA